MAGASALRVVAAAVLALAFFLARGMMLNPNRPDQIAGMVLMGAVILLAGALVFTWPRKRN